MKWIAFASFVAGLICGTCVVVLLSSRYTIKTEIAASGAAIYIVRLDRWTGAIASRTVLGKDVLQWSDVNP